MGFAALSFFLFPEIDDPALFGVWTIEGWNLFVICFLEFEIC